MSMLDAALAAIARGFWIFPVAVRDKVPHRLAGEWGKTATNDVNRVVQFWSQVDQNANVGVACKPSQLLVVDLDKAKEDNNLRGTALEYLHSVYGPRVDGDEAFAEMIYKVGGKLDDINTYRVKTGSGGLHLYYRWPCFWPKCSQASPVKGLVDVRNNGGTDGGYVLAEGSVTEAGEYLLQGDYDIGLPPEWLRHLVVEKPRIQAPRRPQGIRQPGAVSWSGLVESVRNAGEGNRNNATTWAARTMCEEGATLEEAMKTLGPAAEDAGLGSMEVERTIRSAYRTQEAKGV